MTSDSPAFDLRAVVLSGFLPAALFAIGEGAIIPIIPIAADSLGAGLAFAGFVASLILVGELIGDVPSGVVVARIGERNAMIGAAGVSVVGLLVCTVAPNSWVLAAGVFLVGVSTAVFALARHAYMTTRSRCTSALAPCRAWAGLPLRLLRGPFIAAGVVHLTGTSRSAFWIHVVCCLAAAAVLLVVRDPATGARGLRRPRRASRPTADDRTDATEPADHRIDATEQQAGTDATEPPTDRRRSSWTGGARPVPHHPRQPRGPAPVSAAVRRSSARSAPAAR